MCVYVSFQNKSSDVISAAESLEFCRVRTCTCSNQFISMMCHISETKKTRANVVFVCIFYTFFCFLFFLPYFFFFCFSKVSHLKDMLAFYHLSYKLNCVFI